MRRWSSRFESLDAGERSFDLITFVASLHHLPLGETLQAAHDMLRPAGDLAVVGLSANRTIADWIWAGLCTLIACLGSWLYHETRDIGVAVAEPSEGLSEIQRVARDILPGAVIRRGLYYRYRLLWRKPER